MFIDNGTDDLTVDYIEKSVKGSTIKDKPGMALMTGKDGKKHWMKVDKSKPEKKTNSKAQELSNMYKTEYKRGRDNNSSYSLGKAEAYGDVLKLMFGYSDDDIKALQKEVKGY